MEKMDNFIIESTIDKKEDFFFDFQEDKTSGILFDSLEPEKLNCKKKVAESKLENLTWDCNGKFAFEAYKVK